MKYTFEILGVSPILYFFSHQQEVVQQPFRAGVEYVGAHKCTLDAVIASIEAVPPRHGWELDQVVNTVVDFWMNNVDSVRHWKKRLEDAGRESLLVARVADIKSLQAEFESLFGDPF